ncbi:MAG: hypothetical protein IPL38_06540 [Rhodobacter sp.]|nr:hypothetical protein [Rhodobacter sp.]
MSDRPQVPDFGSAEDFGALMEGLSGHLHARNRIWMGESGYVWQVAQLLRAIGRDFGSAVKDAAVKADFGEAYQPARLSDEAQLDALLARLRAHLLTG